MTAYFKVHIRIVTKKTSVDFVLETVSNNPTTRFLFSLYMPKFRWVVNIFLGPPKKPPLLVQKRLSIPERSLAWAWSREKSYRCLIPFVIIRPGDIALMAFVFARYPTTLYAPWENMFPAYATFAITILTIINMHGGKDVFPLNPED